MKKLLIPLIIGAILTGCSAAPLQSGLGMHTSRISADPIVSADGAVTNDGILLSTVTACSLSVDEEGFIVDISFDVTNSRFTVDGSGVSTTDTTLEARSNKELGIDYGLAKSSPLGLEWDVQAEAFEQWAIGRTVIDVLAIPTKSGEISGNIPDVAELSATCAIDITDMLKALESAAADLSVPPEPLEIPEEDN